MNLRFLRTVIAISEYPTFVAAGEALGLSHSAVSVHIKSLEDELGMLIVDRRKRPPILTDRGIALIENARRIFEIIDNIKSLGDEEALIGSMTMGVVPSALVNLVPPALAALRLSHPKLQIKIKAELSAELAQQVRNRDIDVAILTEPESLIEGLRSQYICDEPFNIIAPADVQASSSEELLSQHPFIWFNRRTWAGQLIERQLNKSKIHVHSVMEVNSLEAIESLVRNGIGISIVPQRVCAPAYDASIKVVPFGDPQTARRLVLVDRINNPRARLANALLRELLLLSGAAGAE
ncbi:MAG: LysR family transcriptional regulator [Pseudomonadales bacterium]|nr:LysR family transcriptional regulator [Pseudomonadales bacterium]NRA14672.1 LysR family transcriptional regulator [Oceanospirillaceae bacterium]